MGAEFCSLSAAVGARSWSPMRCLCFNWISIEKHPHRNDAIRFVLPQSSKRSYDKFGPKTSKKLLFVWFSHINTHTNTKTPESIWILLDVLKRQFLFRLYPLNFFSVAWFERSQQHLQQLLFEEACFNTTTITTTTTNTIKFTQQQ